MNKKVLDVCCGSRMFWFDKNDDRSLFNDIRSESHILCDGRSLDIKPDTTQDFSDMNQFKDDSFSLVVFDPPHLERIGDDAWMRKKYGRLDGDWREMIRKGFSECFRVLKNDGVLIFKWNETQIKVSEILKLTENKPLFGHRSGKASNTHWIAFIK